MANPDTTSHALTEIIHDFNEQLTESICDARRGSRAGIGNRTAEAFDRLRAITNRKLNHWFRFSKHPDKLRMSAQFEYEMDMELHVYMKERHKRNYRWQYMPRKALRTYLGIGSGRKAHSASTKRRSA